MRKTLGVIARIAVSIAALLIIAILVIRFGRLTDKMIYANNHTYGQLSSDFSFRELCFDVGKGVKIHAALFKPASGKPVATIFHVPGQGMHLMSVQKEYGALIASGFQVFSYERRGFAHPSGKADNSLLLKQDELRVFDVLLKRADVKDTKIIIWGQSIGGPFAVTAAAERDAKISGLVIEGTFGSFPELGQVFAQRLKLEKAKWLMPLLMNNDFPVKEEIQRVTVPTVIIHSTDDKDIPFSLGYESYEAANKKNTVFWKIKGEHIRGILNYEQEYISRFKNMVPVK